MEDNQDKKQDGGKGLLIIIAIVILAVAAYFIIQGVNKKDKGSNQPTVSISEEDKLELSSLNLQGIWNKTVGTDRYELNFKMTKELVLTQYDKNGEVAVKSDEGTYSVENGVLNLTVVANGQTSTAAATAVLSDKYLIITVTEGSEIFAGTYTADREGISDVDNSGTESTIDADSAVSKPDSVASDPESFVSTPVSDDNSIYQLLSSNVTDLILMTPQELMAASSTAPLSNERGGMQVTINGYKITFGFSNGALDNNGKYSPTDDSDLDWIFIPCEMFFSYPADGAHGEIKGKQSYTYKELEAIYGDKLSNFYEEPEMNIGGYHVSADIDGYYVTFSSSESWAPLFSLDEPITYCSLSFMP